MAEYQYRVTDSAGEQLRREFGEAVGRGVAVAPGVGDYRTGVDTLVLAFPEQPYIVLGLGSESKRCFRMGQIAYEPRKSPVIWSAASRCRFSPGHHDAPVPSNSSWAKRGPRRIIRESGRLRCPPPLRGCVFPPECAH